MKLKTYISSLVAILFFSFCFTEIEHFFTLVIEQVEVKIVSVISQDKEFCNPQFFRAGNDVVRLQKIEFSSNGIKNDVVPPNVINSHGFPLYVYTKAYELNFNERRYLMLYGYSLSNARGEVSLIYDLSGSLMEVISTDPLISSDESVNIFQNSEIEQTYDIFVCQ